MSSFIETMVLVAVMAGGFETAPAPPNVIVAPEAEIRVACRADDLVAEKFFGCFHPKMPSLIFLTETEEVDVEAMGTLLHEIVHYVQYHNGRLEQGTDGLYGCQLWLAAETQAFNIEIEWVERQGASAENLRKMLESYRFVCAE